MVKRNLVERFLNIEDDKVESELTDEEVRVRKSPKEGQEGYRAQRVDFSKGTFSEDRGEELGFVPTGAGPLEETNDYFGKQKEAKEDARQIGVGFFAEKFFSASVSPTYVSSPGVERDVEDVEEGDIPVSVTVGAGVREVHKDRSERARDVDNQRRAEITTDEEQWLKHPNRFDFPGVDTPTANDNQYGVDDVLSVEESEEKAQPMPWFLK